MPALNPKSDSVVVSWLYCVYAALAILVSALGPGEAPIPSGGVLAASAYRAAGDDLPRGVVITADADAHEESAVVETLLEAGPDADAVTGSCLPFAYGGVVRSARPAAAQAADGAMGRRKLPRGPPAGMP